LVPLLIGGDLESGGLPAQIDDGISYHYGITQIQRVRQPWPEKRQSQQEFARRG
jgi:hypothetical protein